MWQVRIFICVSEIPFCPTVKFGSVPKTLAFNSGQKFRHSRYPHTPILVREIVFEA